MSYSELKKEYVIQTIAKGTRVLVCDFKAMKISDCSDMTIKAINSYIAKSETIFFTEVVNE